MTYCCKTHDMCFRSAALYDKHMTTHLKKKSSSKPKPKRTSTKTKRSSTKTKRSTKPKRSTKSKISTKPKKSLKAKRFPIPRTAAHVNCLERMDKKYQNRPSPPYGAQDCKGVILLGNDKKVYQSIPDKNDVYRWKLLKNSDDTVPYVV